MLIIYKIRVRQRDVESFKKLAYKTLIPEAVKLPGCKFFDLYQGTENSLEFIFHESWEDEASVHTYKENLIRILGEPHSGEEFPAYLNDMIEADEDLVYE